MEFYDIIKRRRSIRKFDQKPVEEDIIQKLIEYVSLVPSSRSIYPVRVYYTTEPERIIALSKAKAHGSEFLASATLVFIICADTTKSDVWIEDASIAATYTLLAAEDFNLGATWVQIRNRFDKQGRKSEDVVKEVIGIDDPGIAVLCMIGMGYKGESKSPSSSSSMKEYFYRV
ncbi:MAG: nitroreductase family protein [Candidatus Marinimicrobia bacterium]|nr:nitroreductase family protein [Candidatus Neomarinimicrobiota bacterium]